MNNTDKVYPQVDDVPDNIKKEWLNNVPQSTPQSMNNSTNVQHKVTLTEGQISTILYIMEGYIDPSDDYAYDPDFREDVDNVFKELETVVDTFYNANNDPLIVKFPDVSYRELTPFEEELEIQKYIRDNED